MSYYSNKVYKTVAIRLSPEMYGAVENIATTHGITITDVFRELITKNLISKSNIDPETQNRLAKLSNS